MKSFLKVFGVMYFFYLLFSFTVFADDPFSRAENMFNQIVIGIAVAFFYICIFRFMFRFYKKIFIAFVGGKQPPRQQSNMTVQS